MIVEDASKADVSLGTPTRMPVRAPWLMVYALMTLYVLSFIDRTIMSMLVTPIERDVQLGDFQMSILIGPAFGVFYLVAGLFMGALVDRFRRKWVAVGGVVLWGTSTLLNGFSRSFPHLLLGRLGVGIGEATLTPVAHSLIAESFPASRLSTAIAVFTMGSVIGTGLALILGGTIVQLASNGQGLGIPFLNGLHNWQVVFVVAGALTLIALPLLALVHEPQRRSRMETRAAETAGQESFVGFIARQWRFFVLLPVGFGCANVLSQGALIWHPTYMIRAYGMPPLSVGWTLGIQHLIAGIVGQIGSALLVDRLYARGVSDAHVKYYLIGLFVTVPTLICALAGWGPGWFVVLSTPFYVLGYPFVAYSAAALQLFAPTHLRGRISAFYLAVITLLGTFFGAPTVGWLTEYVVGREHIGEALVIHAVVFGLITFVTLWYAARAMRAMACTTARG